MLASARSTRVRWLSVSKPMRQSPRGWGDDPARPRPMVVTRQRGAEQHTKQRINQMRMHPQCRPQRRCRWPRRSHRHRRRLRQRQSHPIHGSTLEAYAASANCPVPPECKTVHSVISGLMQRCWGCAPDLAFCGFLAAKPSKTNQKKIFRGWLCHPQTPAGGDVATALLVI